MLDSEHSGNKTENEKEVAVDSGKPNEDKKSKVEEGGEVGTPSLSSGSPGKPGGENGVVAKKEDEAVNTTKTNGAKDIIKTTNGSMEAMDADDGEKAVKVEEDVEMKDAETEKPNKNDKDNTSNSADENTKDKDKDNTGNQTTEKQTDTDNPQSAAEEEKEEKKVDGDKPKTESGAADSGGGGDASNKSTSAAAPAAAPNPPPPVLKGTLSYNLDLRRHVIRGMWNYENSNAFPPQRFELLRTLEKDEDPKILPKDGEFHGSFSLAYFHTTSKGKQKERSKVISEHGVKIVFTKIDDKEEFKVDGKGTNQFGIFHINGNATPSQHEGVPEYDIVLRKRYEPSPQAPARADGAEGGGKKRKSMEESGAKSAGPLPPPSKSFPTGVVCLRGNLFRDEPEELGNTDVVHRINGIWANSLSMIVDDPQNVNGNCNKFEYEHKSAVPTSTFPVSGRYSGWFHLTAADLKRSTISERDVNLRFIKNSEGYHNVEGRGLNAFGKYTITGSLSKDNVLTLFRHFKPIKQSKAKPSKTTSVTSAPPPINRGVSSSRRPQHTFPEPRLKLDEVKVPGEENGELLPPIQPPDNTTYSAVSQGVLRFNDDGAHQCTGKWAVTREHFTSGQTSPFNFRLEPHYALEAVNAKKKSEGVKVEETTEGGTPAIPQDFPLDSALYKGSFQLKKKGTRYDTIVDQQIVMKFRKSSSGAYNVYGTGVNSIGVFNLIGTLIMRGKAGGQVELYRMYPPALLVKKTAAPASAGNLPGKGPVFPKASAPGALAPLPESSIPPTQLVSSSSTIMPPRAALARRESTRLVKLPSRLEDDDPRAQLARIMEKCVVILRHIREKDVERGAFFSEPVDPDALGIPNYRQIITEPMDLGTVARRLEGNQIDTPEEFARLVRLTFENAITFNVDPNHSVHLVARTLLVEFNKKFRDIERLLESLRRAHKGADLDKDGKKMAKKDVKKRKRGQDEPKSLKRRRLDEAQAMSADNQKAMAAIVGAAPQGAPNGAVSRGEFNMMLHMIQLLQKQIVQTHSALAELSPGDEVEDSTGVAVSSGAPAFDPIASLASKAAPAPAPERKKSKKKASEPAAKKQVAAPAPAPAPVVEEHAITFDETKPLTLQEQETLTETINNMPADHIPGVIQIIRESASLNGDEDEIDLEIDQLDTVTQRKLLRHVSKYIKQPKRSKSKVPRKPKAAAPAPAPAPAPKPPPKKAEKPPAKKPASPKKSDPGSFFAAFGGKDDSDSDSDDEPPKQTATTTPAGSGGKHFPSSDKAGGFEDSFSGLNNDDDDDDDLGGGLTANWNISKTVSKDAEKDKGGGDDDDDWGAARETAESLAKRNADREAREKKQKEDAEKATQQRLLDAAAKSEEIKQKQKEEEEAEAKKKAEKEEEERKAIEAERAKIRAQDQSVEQTVDMDVQRDIMKQYEQSFLDKELGSASPSSDFGF